MVKLLWWKKQSQKAHPEGLEVLTLMIGALSAKKKVIGQVTAEKLAAMVTREIDIIGDTQDLIRDRAGLAAEAILEEGQEAEVEVAANLALLPRTEGTTNPESVRRAEALTIQKAKAQKEAARVTERNNKPSFIIQ
eukprot:TRINITY_DN2801_c0_g1_i1.p3 TRINITY_DN2801_c0_g1~~TRINITY_DN2801_c0_g1_i1.p3  ORF type:complete len:136 (-),score=34.18 TRINITY_DN2801_c0_g1_i1:7-414(-)